MVEEIASATTVPGLNKNESQARLRLKEACSEFESVFITHMLKSMRSAVGQNGIIGNSHESKIFKAMFDENLALGISKSGGIGIGSVLIESIEEQSP